MPCFHPNQAVQDYPGAKPRFTNYELSCHSQMQGALWLPCGQCWWCRLNRATQWAVRCMHEKQMTTDHEFITLTFNDAHLPKDWSLDRRYWQLFMKRVRKLYGKGPRYFGCGEYGDNLGRPHFHAIMFNFPLKDKKPIFSQGGRTYYTSETLQRLWSDSAGPIGYVMTTGVSFASAQYVARYVTKKMTGKKSRAHYRVMICATGEIVELQPEFPMCSTDPGIGSSWFDKYGLTDLFPKDFCTVQTSDGAFRVAVPRYYMKKLEKVSPDLYISMKARRLERAKELAPDNTPERLLAKEKEVLAKARERLLSEAGRKFGGSYELKSLQYLRCEELGL